MSDLIAAIATGSTATAIGIVRVSGIGCFAACDRVFRPRNGVPFAQQPSHKMVFGEMLDDSGAAIDQGLAVRFGGGHSYTGEDSAEFHCHGSPVVLHTLLSALFAAGARQAQAGEFTKRAFLNGKMDLTEAEAVIDLIDAQSAAAAKNAAAQLDGGLRRRLEPVQEALIDITSRFYAVVDYPDEDIEDIQPQQIRSSLQIAADTLSALLDTAQRGRVLKNGVRTAIVGLPNAGKSSLLNALAGYDRAIVTDIPGTTRDTVEESVLGGGETVYMTAENLYLCASVYDDGAGKTYKDGSYTVTDYTSSVNTVVNRFAIADGKLTFAANGAVAGALNNQFSLDERDGYLRMATTEQTYAYSVYRDEKHDFENTKTNDDATQTRNDVYVLDSDLTTVGSVAGLAEGETVFSARFDGDYGYLCTYRQTDPVFAVDLTDPANPKVVGELKLSGYSDYLHVWSDGLLFGLGMETQAVDGATVDGMKLVMIDTSDPAKLHDLHTQSIDADYSEALYNHKAILVDSGKDLIAFPAENSYLVYGYSADDGFTLRKEIPVSQWDENNRGLYIGDYFYVVGSDQVNVLDLGTLENVAQAIIPRG